MEAIQQSLVAGQQSNFGDIAAILGQINAMPNPRHTEFSNYPLNGGGQSVCLDVPNFNHSASAMGSATSTSLTDAVDRLSQRLHALIERMGNCFCGHIGTEVSQLPGASTQTERGGFLSSISSFLRDKEAVQGTLSSVATLVPGLGWLSNSPKIVAAAQMLGNFLGAFGS